MELIQHMLEDQMQMKQSKENCKIAKYIYLFKINMLNEY